MKSAAARSTRFTSCSSLPSRNARTHSAIHSRQLSLGMPRSRTPSSLLHLGLTPPQVISRWKMRNGETDRHHENWMVAYAHHCGDMWIEIMPSYDHASSLGRELTDDERQHILDSDGVQHYLDAGRGAIHVDSRRKRAPSPLRLARLLCRWRPEYTTRTLERIGGVSEDEIRTTIEKVPDEFKSEITKEFAFQVVMAGKRELLRSVR